MAFLSRVPWCQDWLLLHSLTSVHWRRTDQIRDTMRQMSALAFCSRLRAAGANTKEDREKTARAKAAREDIWHKTEQCRGGRCAPGSVLIQRHTAARRLLCHGSVRQQPVWAQSDTASLDKPGAAALTPTDPRGGTGSHACTKSTRVLTLNQCTAVDKHSDTKLKDTHAQLVNLHRNNDQTVAATEASERQNSMYDLRSTALPLCAHFEEQHAERR